MTTDHGMKRMKDRIARLQLAEQDYLRVLARALAAARKTEDGSSLAVMVKQLDHSHAIVTEDPTRPSKGDQVWAIVRDGVLVTVMLRNSTQPISAKKMRVDRLAYC